MTKEMEEALKSVLDIIVRENPNAIRATIEFETPGVCTVEVESKDGILLRRLWLQLSCDFGSDYEILKTICDYATLTRPAPSPIPYPEMPGPCPSAPPGSDWRVSHLSRSPWPPDPMPPRPRHAAQGGTKSRTLCKFATPGKRLLQACTTLTIVVLCAAYTVTELASPRKQII